MPNIPFSLFGLITDIDTSTVLASCRVTAKNLTQTGTTSTTTNSNGEYLLDLANMATSWDVGDVISVKAVKSTRVRISNFTITQAMLDDGGYTHSFTVYVLEEHIFDVLYSLFSSNLPPDFSDTFNETTSTVSWSITSSFPEIEPSFPVLILNPAQLSDNLVTMTSGSYLGELSAELGTISRARFGKKRVDNARGYMRQVLLDNESTLNYGGLYFAKEEFIDNSNVADILIAKEKFNLSNQILKFRVSL